MKGHVEMVLHRTALMSSTLGHMINFEKDVPINIPLILVSTAAQMGAVPTNAKIDPFEVVTEERVAQPVAPGDRLLAISAVLDDIVEENNVVDFTANGTPKVLRVSQRLGYKVDRTEVSKAWSDRANDA